jgi:nitrilase
MSSFHRFHAAVVQATPALFDRDATLERVGELTAAAAAEGADLVVFPEAFVPAYPRGLSFGAVVGSRSPAGRDLWARYWDASLDVPGAGVERLGAIAAQHRVELVIGVIERAGTRAGGTLYCTTLYIGPDGRLQGRHRKLKPTGSERLVWGEGDGSTLTVVDTPWGRLGGLICWEHYMPLARTAIYEQGVDLWVAPTADARDGWQATMRHVAMEGRCFVFSSNQYVRRADYPGDLQSLIETDEEEMCRGGSVIVSPLGEVLAGPTYGSETILIAQIDTREIARARYDLDPVGHYARPDLFRLHVDRTDRSARLPADQDAEPGS